VLASERTDDDLVQQPGRGVEVTLQLRDPRVIRQAFPRKVISRAHLVSGPWCGWLL
jgi:hypothetical protein